MNLINQLKEKYDIKDTHLFCVSEYIDNLRFNYKHHAFDDLIKIYNLSDANLYYLFDSENINDLINRLQIMITNIFSRDKNTDYFLVILL